MSKIIGKEKTMFLPSITTAREPMRARTLDFRGFNDSPVIEDGEMRDMLNLSSEKYPHLYQRNLRNTYSSMFTHPIAIFARREKLAVVDIQTIDSVETGVFYYGTITVDGKAMPKRIHGLELSTEEKAIAAINTRIVIFPDKKWFNTETEEYGDVDFSAEATDDVVFTATTMTFPGTGTPFAGLRAGDAVSITGCTSISANNISAIVQAIDGLVVTFPDNSFTAGTETGTVKIARTAPEMDFIMESNNRLWGCKGSSIYASKLGDPLNWNSFQGLTDDSYAVDVGTDGDFTGCVPYASHLLFFKENYIHKMYGSKPSNYNLVTAECYSLEAGSHQSVQVVNEVVFYKSRLGIMAYQGGSPELISKNFGTRRYGTTVAGTDGIKYFASMAYGTTYDLMVFDLDKMLWHKEDHAHARCFAYINGELIYIDDETDHLISVNPLTADESDQIEWMALLGDFDEFIEDKKIYSKIKMRFNLHDDSALTISINADNRGWVQVAHIYAETARAVYIPIIPQRCDKFRIKLEGVGLCEIESMVREYAVGSER